MKPFRLYNWHADRPDHRDQFHSPDLSRALPAFVDLRPEMPPVFDQGKIGSCTGNALAGAMGFLAGKAAEPYSRLFIYYFERLLEGDPDQDGGAQIRDGVKVLHKIGACAEKYWPYDRARLFQRPDAGCESVALAHRITKYLRVNHSNICNVEAALAEGHPVAFGFTVFDSFESDEVARTGLMPMPGPGEGVQGGHAVLAVGYDAHNEHLIVRNSWGSTWGDGGHFYMPYEYVQSRLATDFWTIRR